MIKLNYGKYAIPEKLYKIIELQKHLHEEELLDHGDLFGYYFSLEGLDSRYLSTPLDVISFATPGSDGIHYGFLTDFGQVDDLEKAYVVRVSPMDFDEPVKIVARSIYDFMRILCFSPIALDLVDISTNESDFKKYPELSTVKYNNVGENQVRGIFRETFQLEPIEFIRDYLQKVKRERENEIVLSSADGIGVVNKKQHTKNGVNNQDLLHLNSEQTLKIEEVKHLFECSSYESKLVFLRDAQSKGLIYDNEEVKLYLKGQLRLMHLNDEAERISHP